MKVSPIAEIRHKSKAFRSILDLSFSLKLTPHGRVPSVNENSEKTAPGGATDQIGHVLLRLIHAFSEAPDCANIFQAKWDIKDGFWRLYCKEGEEWDLCYFLPQKPGMPIWGGLNPLLIFVQCRKRDGMWRKMHQDLSGIIGRI